MLRKGRTAAIARAVLAVVLAGLAGAGSGRIWRDSGAATAASTAPAGAVAAEQLFVGKRARGLVMSPGMGPAVTAVAFVSSRCRFCAEALEFYGRLHRELRRIFPPQHLGKWLCC
jgi:hypothetical protein